MNCAEIIPHLEAYSLGALEPEMRAHIEAHLVECDACRRAAHQYAIVAHTLPDALAKASLLIPPTGLKHNLLAAAQADVQGHALARNQSAARRVKSAPAAHQGHWLLNPRLWTWSLATAMLIILGLMGWLTLTHLRLQEALTNETAALEQLHTYRLSEDARAKLTSLENPEQVYMTSKDAESNIWGTLTFDSHKPYVVFQAHNLPPAELNKQYFLWTMNEGRMQLVARFSPKPNGDIQVSFSVDREYPVLKRVILTRQVSLREITSDEFPSNESILEWDVIKARNDALW
jgi:hypothetical protein